MLTNMDKLYESVAANGPVCVGLDTEISYLPTTDTAKTAGENVVAFNRALIDATKGVAGCYKVQIAYYESLGLDGMRAYAETLKLARATGLPVIADIKRGDIAKTAEMYAKAHFTGDFEADIITLAPYMGLDSISPYLPYCAEQGKGVFVLCRTSNPGGDDIQMLEVNGEKIYERLARLAADRRKFYPGMPTVTYDCPAYSTDYWRGQTWLNVAFFAIKGLENYGFTGVAGEIREFLLSMAYDGLDRGISENYDSINRRGKFNNAFSWSAAFLIELILDR